MCAEAVTGVDSSARARLGFLLITAEDLIENRPEGLVLIAFVLVFTNM
jgi:hypothetical protein